MSFCYLLSGFSPEKHIDVYRAVKQKRLKSFGIQMNYSFSFNIPRNLKRSRGWEKKNVEKKKKEES